MQNYRVRRTDVVNLYIRLVVSEKLFIHILSVLSVGPSHIQVFVICFFFFCNLTHTTKVHFTLGVRANVLQPKSSIPIGAKVEIGPKDFTPGVKAEIEKK